MRIEKKTKAENIFISFLSKTVKSVHVSGNKWESWHIWVLLRLKRFRPTTSNFL